MSSSDSFEEEDTNEEENEESDSIIIDDENHSSSNMDESEEEGEMENISNAFQFASFLKRNYGLEEKVMLKTQNYVRLIKEYDPQPEEIDGEEEKETKSLFHSILRIVSGNVELCLLSMVILFSGFFFTIIFLFSCYNNREESTSFLVWRTLDGKLILIPYIFLLFFFGILAMVGLVLITICLGRASIALFRIKSLSVFLENVKKGFFGYETKILQKYPSSFSLFDKKRKFIVLPVEKKSIREYTSQKRAKESMYQLINCATLICFVAAGLVVIGFLFVFFTRSVEKFLSDVYLEPGFGCPSCNNNNNNNNETRRNLDFDYFQNDDETHAYEVRCFVECEISDHEEENYGWQRRNLGAQLLKFSYIFGVCVLESVISSSVNSVMEKDMKKAGCQNEEIPNFDEVCEVTEIIVDHKEYSLWKCEVVVEEIKSKIRNKEVCYVEEYIGQEEARRCLNDVTYFTYSPREEFDFSNLRCMKVKNQPPSSFHCCNEYPL